MGFKTYSITKKYIDPKKTPFYVEDASGSDNYLTIRHVGNGPSVTVEKSLDGKTWESMGTTSSEPITATVPANGKLYLRGSNQYGWGSYSSYYYYNSITCTGLYNVGGNIMSLTHGNEFSKVNEIPTVYNGAYFARLFSAATSIYESAQNNKLLNAENLLLPATTLDGRVYAYMFNFCSALLTAPKELPGTTVPPYAYEFMFYQCGSLSKSPDMIATGLSEKCYQFMYGQCQNLNHIKCLYSPYSPPNGAFNSWVKGVSNSGTFETLSSTAWSTGNNGIPSGWTRVNV